MSEGEPLEAVWYGGETGAGRRVMLRVDASGGWSVQSEGLARSYRAQQVRVMPASGRSARSILFDDGTQCEVADHERFDRAVAAAGGRRDWVAEMEARLPWAIGVLIAAAAFTWAIYQYGIPAAARSVAFNLPADTEKRIGQDSLASLEGLFLRPSALSAERRERISGRFRELSSGAPAYRLEFRQMSGNVANAVALPGGVIVMSDALVALAVDDDEVIAVLAHELGHLEHRHTLRQLLQSSVLQLFAAFIFNDASGVASLGNSGAALAGTKYSRDFEREADDFAFGFLQRSGIPAQKFADILKRLAASGPQGTVEFVSTHPATADRVLRFEGR